MTGMKKKVIALTGGIGSGKSTAGRFFRENGYKVVDCDAISREVSQLAEVLEKISTVFGKKFVIDGMLDRRALASEVFDNQEKTQKLNEIFHAKILQLLTEELEIVNSGIVFVEIPLLEKKFLHLFDEIWLFKANENNILQRVVERDGRTQTQIADILCRQKEYRYPDDTVVVYNDGSLEDLQNELRSKLQKLILELDGKI